MKIIVAPAHCHGRIRALAGNVELHTDATEVIGTVEIVFGHVGPDQFSLAPSLRWLQTVGAGVDSLLTPEVKAHPAVITNASGIHAEPITEHMFAMLLAVVRNLHEAHAGQAGRVWNGLEYATTVGKLAGRTLGVLGVGAIGGHSAHVGKALGMRVVGLRRTGEPHPAVDQMFVPDDRLRFFSEADIVFNTLPLTPHTRHFIGTSELASMATGGIIANTGRGATIDTEALINALERGHLAAALLDVTDPEPLPADHRLWSTTNCHITPHYAGFHPGYMDRATEIFIDNLARYLRGAPLHNVVDKQWGY